MQVRLDNNRFAYPARGFRLEAPELHIPSGACVAFVGPSGSGKTTLLRLIAGILTPADGTVHVGDRDIASMPERQRRRLRASRIGFIFQDFRLLDHLDVRENVRLPLRISRDPAHREAVAHEPDRLLNAVGMEGKANARPRTLSQGEKQRAAICRALVTKPGLILADEPTGNLDPANKQRTLDLVVRCAKDSGATLIVVTHDEALLPAFDRVIDFSRLLAPIPAEAN